MKRKFAFILIGSLVLYSLNCGNSVNTGDSVNSNDSVSSGVVETQTSYIDSTIIRKQEEAYSKTVAKLNSINLPKTEQDSIIIQTLGQFNFQNQDPTTTQLPGNKCPFTPYMFIVHDFEIEFLNSHLDSTYQLDFDGKIHTACWSPFNKSEIFILARVEKKIPKVSSYYLPESIFDLKLLCLNIQSMQLKYLTTFLDYTIPVNKNYKELDPPEFFVDKIALKVDKLRSRIYYDCFHPWDPEEYYSTHLTYSYDLNLKTTVLSKSKSIKADNFQGNKIEVHKAYITHQNDSNFIQINDTVNIVVSDRKDLKIKIPQFIFNENNIEFEEYGYIGFSACFTDNYIVCSPYIEREMGLNKGSINLVGKNGRFIKQLLKDRVLGENLSLRALRHKNYLLGDPYSYFYVCDKRELYLYNSSFDLLREYNNVLWFEIKQ